MPFILFRFIMRTLKDIRRLARGIRSEKCVVRQFCRANVIEYTYPQT